MKTKISWKGLLPALGYLGIYIALQIVCYSIMFWAFEETSEKVYFDSMPFTILVSSLGVIVVYICIFAAQGKNIARELSLEKFKPLALVAAIITGLALGGLITNLIATSSIYGEEMWNYEKYDFFPNMPNMKVLGFLMAMVIWPIAKEVVFRVMVYKNLRSGLPAILSVLLSALLFGLTGGNLIGCIEMFCIGVIAAILFEWTESVWITLAFHIAYNFIHYNFMGFGSNLTPEIRFWMIVCSVVLLIMLTLIIAASVKKALGLKVGETKKAVRQSAKSQSERKVTMPPEKKVETGTANSVQRGIVNHGVVVEDTLNLDD